MLKRAIIGIILLSYVSGILTIALGYVFHYSASDEPMPDTFVDTVKKLPWVTRAHTQKSNELLYYNQIIHLYVVDNRIGYSLLNANWIKDFISKEEAHALGLLVVLAEEDANISLSVSQSLWFRKGISAGELALMEDIVALMEQNIYVAKNITSSNWFFIHGTDDVKKIVTTMAAMPSDLALSVSFAPWFKSNTIVQDDILENLVILYAEDKSLALNLPSVLQLQDFESLYAINELYATDKELVTTFFTLNALKRETVLCLSDLARIAAVDRELAHTLVGEATPDTIQNISALSTIYTDYPEVRELAREFSTNTTALRYLQTVLEVEVMEPDLLKEVALFVSDNPEFVYEDQTEPYRYHLLTKILSEISLDTAQEYKNLLFVTCAMYGSRFYCWQDEAYNVRNGWAYDKYLSDLEKEAVIDLITFFIEKNEQLVVDVREESYAYLYGLVDIPFTHLVSVDGMVADAAHTEQGTAYVFAIMSNIDTLRQRYDIVQQTCQKMGSMQYGYSNPLVDLILEEGEPRDVLFVYFCAKNWEFTPCVNQTLQTRMDCIVTGISTTTMYWYAPDSAHVYPAYKPTVSITKKIQANPDTYGNPFVYKEFAAPYDEAGFNDYLNRSIESVEIYDPQSKKKVCLFLRSEEPFYRKVPVLIGLGALIVLIGGTLKIAKG